MFGKPGVWSCNDFLQENKAAPLLQQTDGVLPHRTLWQSNGGWWGCRKHDDGGGWWEEWDRGTRWQTDTQTDRQGVSASSEVWVPSGKHWLSHLSCGVNSNDVILYQTGETWRHHFQCAKLKRGGFDNNLKAVKKHKTVEVCSCGYEKGKNSYKAGGTTELDLSQ